MKQIADNVWALGSRSHNFYILKDGEQLTVIDAGCSGEWAAFEKGLAELDLSLQSISAVIATHAHSDHFGLAKRATDSGLSVSVHSDEETRSLGTYKGRFAVDSSELPKFNIHALWNFFPMLRSGVTKHEHVDTVNTFDDGEHLDLPGHPVAVHTPGHTEGHTMFHCEALGLLFTGDGLVTMDLLGSGKGPQMMEQRFHLDSTQALASLDRILGLEANLLLPGHGQPWRGSPAEAVSLARS